MHSNIMCIIVIIITNLHNIDGNATVESHSFQAHVGPNRSKSRGRLRAKSADPAAHPMVHVFFCFFGAPKKQKK